MDDPELAAAESVGADPSSDDVDASMSALERSDVYLREMFESVRVLIVAGISVGVIVAGIGSRLAMLMLRLTSSDQVIGVESDDGFTIGQVTLSGTYNLLAIGAAVGVIGAAAYQWVNPWLLGPGWFRSATLAAGAGAVVGSMLIHADGIDFTSLTPTWLAISTFIALPAIFGVAIGPVVDRVKRPSSWAASGRRRWLLPVGLLVLFPPAFFVVVVATFVVVVWVPIRSTVTMDRVRAASVTAWVMRAFWLFIAINGLAALVDDVREIAALT